MGLLRFALVPFVGYLVLLLYGSCNATSTNGIIKSTTTNFTVVVDAREMETTLLVYGFQHGSKLPLNVYVPYSRTISPGLVYYVHNLNECKYHLEDLLEDAKTQVSFMNVSVTPITVIPSGLDFLAFSERTRFMEALESVVNASGFLVYENSVSTLKGRKKIFSWMAVNVLLGRFSRSELRNQVAVIDLGGGSTHDAFTVLSTNKLKKWYRSHLFNLTVLNSTLDVFAYSLYGLGVKDARVEIIKKGRVNTTNMYITPCVPPSVSLTWSYKKIGYMIEGDPSVKRLNTTACLELIDEVFEEYSPSVSLSGKEVYGMSYLYTIAVESKLAKSGQNKNITVKEIKTNAMKLCKLKDKSRPFQCLNALYVHSLLRKMYGLKSKSQITVVTHLHHVNTSWTVGAAFQLYQGNGMMFFNTTLDDNIEYDKSTGLQYSRGGKSQTTFQTFEQNAINIQKQNLKFKHENLKVAWLVLICLENCEARKRAQKLPKEEVKNFTVIIDAKIYHTTLTVYELTYTDTKLTMSSRLNLTRKPGLVTFVLNPQECMAQIVNLTSTAARTVDEMKLNMTPLALYATGVQYVPFDEGQKFLQDVREYFKGSSFNTSRKSVSELRGNRKFYTWLGVNVLLGRFRKSRRTVGIIDVGTRSSHEVFALEANQTMKLKFHQTIVNLTVYGKMYSVFGYSSFGLGLYDGRASILEIGKQNGSHVYKSECIHPSLTLSWYYKYKNYNIQGASNTTSLNMSACMYQVKQVMKQHEPGVKMNDTEIYGLHYLYNVSVQANLTKPGQSKNITIPKLRQRAKKLCQKPDSTVPFLCMDLCFLVQLLKMIYKLTPTQNVTVAGIIKDVPISWSVGAAFDWNQGTEDQLLKVDEPDELPDFMSRLIM